MINAVNEFLDDLRGGKMSESPIVSVEQGQLQGRLAFTPAGKPYYSFQGIPYAKPPLGSLRFQAPKPADPWDGIRDATTEGNICCQKDMWPGAVYKGDENCLFLNVYSPTVDGAFLPVMVFIHGGGFRSGSGNSGSYGPDFLVEKDVVVVTLNYRCGPLGFLCLNTPEVPGNAGLKDIVLALRWVKENIGNFGGNSGNLTIFGESSGGVAVSLFTASPLTKDLISKAIVQSGTCLSSWPWQRYPIENARALAKELGCDSTDIEDILEFLRSTSAQDITEAYCKINPDFGGVELREQHPFVTVIEKEFPNVESVITQPFAELLTSGKVADIPLMIGTTDLEICIEPKTDDLRVFIPQEFNIERQSSEAVEIAEEIKRVYFKNQKLSVETWEVYFELLTDRFVKIDTQRHVKYLNNFTKKPVFVYEFGYFGSWNSRMFDFLTGLGIKRSVHTDELGYLFRQDHTDKVDGTTEDVRTRERMVRLWTNFAKSGNPTPEENSHINVSWLPVTSDTMYYLKIAEELSLETNPQKERMELWDGLYQKYFKIWEQPRSNEDFIEVSRSLGENIVLGEKAIECFAEIKTDVEEPVKEKQQEMQEIETEVITVSEPATEQISVNKIAEYETVEISESHQVFESETRQQIYEAETRQVSESDFQQIESESRQIFEAKTNEIASESHQIQESITNQISQSENNQITETETVTSFVKEKVQISESESVYKVTESLTELDIAPIAETVAKLKMFESKKEQPGLQQKKEIHVKKDSSWIQNGLQTENGVTNGGMANGDAKKAVRTSNEVKMVVTGNGDPKDVIRANDPPEDDLPKNIGVNKFVNFFESLGGKK